MKKRTNDDIRAIIIKNIFTYFNAIFLGITILLLLAGSYRSLTFLPVVVANILIGIVQQIKAKKILDKLTLLSQAKYTVLRDGSKTEATVEALSPGDIIFLEGGQQIPADVEVIEGKIAVNEALLTGEADEIEKRPGSSLLSGSFVVSGACRGRLTAVGEESYIAQLTARAKEMKESPSEMVGDIDWIIKIAGIVILPVGGPAFFAEYGDEWPDLPGIRGIYGWSHDRNDSGRALSAGDRYPGPFRCQAGKETGAASRYEEHRNPCKSGCAVRRQDRNHYQ